MHSHKTVFRYSDEHNRHHEIPIVLEPIGKTFSVRFKAIDVLGAGLLISEAIEMFDGAKADGRIKAPKEWGVPCG